MLDKLESIKKRYLELSEKMADPQMLSSSQWPAMAKEHAALSEMVTKYDEYTKVVKEMEDTEALLKDRIDDPEFRAMVVAELEALEIRQKKLEEELRALLLPRDPNDEKNVIVEIRAGTGGDEAALFAADLYRMYTRYAELHNWRTEVLSSNPTDIGGFKEIIFVVEGRGAYSRLKYESGVHRVQRIPVTESGGRIHTSAATVAVLPEAEEVDIEIDPDDLRIDTFCSSGPGGQSVNTTYSAVRITHIPTGLVVSCQDEKSQHKNKDKAMRVLRARLLALAEEKQRQELSDVRKSQVGTGDRSERIRTYNFPQGRVTDHRIGLTIHRLDEFLDGDIDQIVDQLIMSDRERKLEEASVS
ncbi:MAG: peptide chain release factor 1 [Bacillota bacterium]